VGGNLFFCVEAAGPRVRRRMSHPFKSPREQKQYTFQDFFAADKKPGRKRAMPDATPSPATSAAASPLLAALGAQKKKQKRPAEETSRADTPSGASGGASRGSASALSPPRQRPRAEGGGGGGDGGDGGKAAQLLRPDAQRKVAEKRAAKKKRTLRQATSGLGAARTSMAAPTKAPSAATARRARERVGEEKDEIELEIDDGDRAQSSRPSLFGQNARQQLARSAPKRPAAAASGGGAAAPAARGGAVGPAARPTAAAAAQMSPVAPAGENHKFYLNARRSAPDGEFIDQMHAVWATQYSKLEKHHSYIQWLFPVFENAGVNRKAHPLSKREAKAMREDPVVARRVLRSYRMMLGFYGFTLVNEATGELRKSESWQPRFRNFNSHTHNNLRVSRILVSLGELGFKRYKAPLLEALRVEIFEHRQLPACRKSFGDFWQGLVTDEGEPWYVRKTRETSDDDRAESVFFAELECAAAARAAATAANAAADMQAAAAGTSTSGGVSAAVPSASTAPAAAPAATGAGARPTLAFDQHEVLQLQHTLGCVKLKVLRVGFRTLVDEGRQHLDEAGMVRLQRGLMKQFDCQPDGTLLASQTFFLQLHDRLAAAASSSSSSDADASAQQQQGKVACLSEVIAALAVFATEDALITRLRFGFSLFAADPAQRGDGSLAVTADDSERLIDADGLQAFIAAWFGGGSYLALAAADRIVPSEQQQGRGSASGGGADLRAAIAQHVHACNPASAAAAVFRTAAASRRVSFAAFLQAVRSDTAELQPLRAWLRFLSNLSEWPLLPQAKLLPSWEAEAPSPASTPSASASAATPGASKPASAAINRIVRLWTGDITRLEVDAVVNAANTRLRKGGGICGAIHDAAGAELEDACRHEHSSYCATGDTVVTDAYKLPARKVLHTVGPVRFGLLSSISYLLLGFPSPISFSVFYLLSPIFYLPSPISYLLLGFLWFA
jgi:hypothetical protein